MGDFVEFVLGAGDVGRGSNARGVRVGCAQDVEANSGGGGGLDSYLPPTTEALCFAVNQVQEALQAMNEQMRRTGEMVRLVALGLNVQKQRMNMIRKKVLEVEGKLDYCVMEEKVEDSEEQSDASEMWKKAGRTAEASVQACATYQSSSDESLIYGFVNEPKTAVASVQVSCVTATSEASTATDSDHCRILYPFGAHFTSLPEINTASSTAISPSFKLPSQATQTVLRSVSCTACTWDVPTRRERLGRKLLRAAQDGKTVEVRKLLKEGANPNYQNGSKWTALHIAAMKAHPDIISLLLQRGAKVNLKNVYGYTALHMAAYNDPSGLCACFLIYEGCNVDTRNQFGRTALHYAAECGNDAVVRALLRAGAKRTQRDEKGNTPYDLAKDLGVRQLLAPFANTEGNDTYYGHDLRVFQR